MDCKYYQVLFNNYYCGHPSHLSIINKKPIYLCQAMRQSLIWGDSLCGPEAKLFEKPDDIKSKPKSILKNL